MINKLYRFSFDVENNGQYQEGDMIEIQILRKGKRKHYSYGEVKVDDKMMDLIVSNFNENVLRQEIPVDINHDDNKEAVARFTSVYRKGDGVFASIKLNKLGAEKLSDKRFKYFSPEYIPQRTDGEKNKTYNYVLTGGGFTNMPYFKEMQKVVASDPMSKGMGTDNNSYFIFYNYSSMDDLKTLLSKYKDKEVLNFSEKFDLMTKFKELTEDEQKEVASEVETTIAKKKKKKMKEAKKEDKKEEDKKEFSDESAIAQKYADLQKKVDLMESEKQTREFSESFDNLAKNENGLLPKDKEAVVEFCQKIGAENSKIFFEILGNLKSVSEFKKEIKEGNGKKQYSSQLVDEYLKNNPGVSRLDAITEVYKICE